MSSRGAASTTVTLVPKRAKPCASSQPIAPPPSTTSDARRGVGLDRLAIGPHRAVHAADVARSASPSIGGIAGAVPVAITTRRRGVVSSPPSTRSRPSSSRPASRPAPRTKVPPWPSKPLDRHLVVPVVGRLVADAVARPARSRAARSRCPASCVDAAGLGERFRAAQDHLRRDAAVVGALAADQSRRRCRAPSAPASASLRPALRRPGPRPSTIRS